MGRRGPVSQPAHLRVLRGNPGKRQSPDSVAKVVQPGRPQCPDWLSEIAKAEWDKLIPRLDALGLISEIDAGVLATYCSAYAHMVEAEELVARSGILAEGQHQIVRNPAWVALKDARAQVLALSKELYLSPVSRLRATTTPQEDPQSAIAREILD